MLAMQNLPPALRHPIKTIRAKFHAARLNAIKGALNDLKVLKSFREAYPMENAALISSLTGSIASMPSKESQILKTIKIAKLLSSLQKACGNEDCFYMCLNALSSPAVSSFTARNTGIMHSILAERTGTHLVDFFSALAGIGRANYRTVEFGFVSCGKSITLVKINGEWEIKGNARTVLPSESIPHYSVDAFRNAPVLTGA